MTEPILSTKSYVLAYVGLMALLGLNVGLAYINMGWVSMFVALTIATLQVAILSLVLMHGLFEKVLVRLIMAGALLWFLILMTLTMVDYITRNWVPVSGK